MKDHHTLIASRLPGRYTMDAKDTPSRPLSGAAATVAHRPWQFDADLNEAPQRSTSVAAARPAGRARRVGARNQVRRAVLARHNLAA